MTGFDIAVLLVIAISAMIGFTRGLSQEILALAAWVLAMFAVKFLHSPLTNQLVSPIGTESGAAVLAFALLMLVPYIITKLIASFVGNQTRDTVLGTFDRLLGIGFGAVRGMILVVLGFSVMMLGYDTVWGAGGRPDWIKMARSYPFINASSNSMVDILAQRRAEAVSSEQSVAGAPKR